MRRSSPYATEIQTDCQRFGECVAGPSKSLILLFNLERLVLRRSHTRQNLELIVLFLSIARRSPAGVSNCGNAQIECPPLAKNFVQLRIQHLEGIAPNRDGRRNTGVTSIDPPHLPSEAILPLRGAPAATSPPSE